MTGTETATETATEIEHEEEERLPFTAHLEELRTRLIRCSIAVLLGTVVAYCFKEKLFDILTKPLISALPPNGKIIYTGLPEAFFTYFKVAFITGLLAASPVIIYQFWMFVAPGLYKKERLFLAPIMFVSLLFFAGGSLFGYYYVLPVGYKFFVGFSSDTIQAMPSMKEYLALTSKMLLAFGLVFELPIVLTGMAAIGIVTPAFLRKNRKYAIVLAFVIGGVLTPSPDVVSQLLMAGPLIVLYELSIIGAMIFGRKPMEEPEETDKEEEPKDGATENKDKETSVEPVRHD